MKETTVYLPVKVEEEMPPLGQKVSVSFDEGKTYSYEATGKNWKADEVNYTHWLKPQQGYFFTKEDLAYLLREAFENGVQYGVERFGTTAGQLGFAIEAKDREQYLQEKGLL